MNTALLLLGSPPLTAPSSFPSPGPSPAPSLPRLPRRASIPRSGLSSPRQCLATGRLLRVLCWPLGTLGLGRVRLGSFSGPRAGLPGPDCLRCSVCCWRSPAPLGSALVCDSSRPLASARSPAKLPRHLAFPRWHRRRVAAGAAGVIHCPPRRRERFQVACARALSNSAGTWSDRNGRDSR